MAHRTTNQPAAPSLDDEAASQKTSENILALLTENPKTSIADIVTGVTTRTIERNLKTLVADNRLRRIGPDKGDRWEVLPPAPDSAQRGVDHGG